MTYLQALIMGIVQGLTEFLPVSSSAHIVLTSHLYKFFTGNELSSVGVEEIFFDIIIHLGTLAAILIYFRNDIIEMIKDFFLALKNRNFSSPKAKTPMYILLGTFITCCVVLPLKKITENLMGAPDIVGLLLLVTAFLLFASETISQRFANKNNEPTLKTAIITGVVQGLAIFPGISRSGSTISAAMLTGLGRVASAKYSFLLSIPIILGASLMYPVLELSKNEVDTLNIGVLIVGFLSSATIGFLCIKYFLKFLQRFSMKIFAYYCAIVGIATFVIFKFFI